MKNGTRKKRMSMICCLNKKNLCAPLFFEGACTRIVFEAYLEQVLIPILPPNSTVIFDNASIHKGGRIVDLIEKAGSNVLYLPTYSPDFNPIEHYWSALKHRIRKFLSSCQNVFDVALQAFRCVPC